MSTNERIAVLDRLCAHFVLECAMIIEQREAGILDKAEAQILSSITLSTLAHLRLLRYALKRQARRKVKLELSHILDGANISQS